MRALNPALLAVLAAFVAWAEEPPVDNSEIRGYDAYVTAAQGRVSIDRDRVPWAISSGERVPVKRLITTGNDGYAHFEVQGGSNFDVYANSRVVFRQNAAAAGDLIDVLSGRVRVHLNSALGQQQRVFCPIASITVHNPATIGLAIDEDDSVRIDVLEGEVQVQHTLLPRGDPTIVKAIDAILVEKDQQISRRVDRGSLYRYAVKSLHDLFSAVTPGHSNGKNGSSHPFISGEFFARMLPSCPPPIQ
jgi:hypothetical protein